MAEVSPLKELSSVHFATLDRSVLGAGKDFKAALSRTPTGGGGGPPNCCQ